MDQFFFPSHGNSSKSKKKHSSRNKKAKQTKDKEVKKSTPSESSFMFMHHPQAADYYTEGEEDVYEKDPSPRRRPSVRTANNNPRLSQSCAARRLYVSFLDFWNSVRLSGPYMRSPDSPLMPDQGHATIHQAPETTAVHFAVHDYTATSAQAPNGIKFVISCSLGDMHQVADLVAPRNSGRRLIVRGLSGQARAGSDLATLVRDGLTSLSLEIFEDP